MFFILVANTDDHLRNHGFLLTEKGWRLSPAFDMNPNPTGTGLTLNISDNDNALDLDRALEVAAYFRVKPVQAKRTIGEMREAVSQWRSLAKRMKIPSSECALMAAAFRRASD